AKRFLSIYPDMKCLFMSGYTPNMIAHQGILDEGVYFIQKPFSKNDLTTRVREILDQK
ncbi:MAG: hybrid sensor histidine kinase/response regulator, partial [Smithella sp.]|nr:hybrid sensor histidine kinase/response regulator [Smithella sp.]